LAGLPKRLHGGRGFESLFAKKAFYLGREEVDIGEGFKVLLAIAGRIRTVLLELDNICANEPVDLVCRLVGM
jgi:hypothetical protein